jgi:hypothetical protein
MPLPQARVASLDPGLHRPTSELLQHAERLIASSIGAASSRLVMSLLLRKRAVSAKAALKLLDDSPRSAAFQPRDPADRAQPRPVRASPYSMPSCN